MVTEILPLCLLACPYDCRVKKCPEAIKKLAGKTLQLQAETTAFSCIVSVVVALVAVIVAAVAAAAARTKQEQTHKHKKSCLY